MGSVSPHASKEVSSPSPATVIAMSEQSAGQRHYVRCGPFGQGVYTDVPTHHFAEHPPLPVMWCGSDLREQYWICCCGTVVSEHQRVPASGHPCDGTPRCAICNVRLHSNRPYAGELMRWAGYICAQCRDAHKDALTVQATSQAVVP